MTSHKRPVEILLVEDNPGDVELTRDAFADSTMPNHIHVAGDGVEALDFLHRNGPYADAPRPDVILLDLNMPRMDGKELLSLIKNDADLKAIPVVVLSSSEAATDIGKSYRLHANCYVSKPGELAQFMRVVHAVEDFWLVMATLPDRQTPRPSAA